MSVRRFLSRRDKSPAVRHSLHEKEHHREPPPPAVCHPFLQICFAIMFVISFLREGWRRCFSGRTAEDYGSERSSTAATHESAPLLRFRAQHARIESTAYRTFDGSASAATELKGDTSRNPVHHAVTSHRLLPANLPSQPKQPEHFAGVFTETPRSPSRHEHDDRRTDKEHEKRLKAITERLRHFGFNNITDANIEYALHHVTPQDDAEAAFRLLLMLEDTYSAILKPYEPSTKLLGAVNRQATTCYLDSLLFSMFFRLENFEAMLYENYTDPKQKRLGALLRLWVNMLRTGRLITTDVTALIQDALAQNGWRDAAKCMQQDPSEAFGFITEKLELPMLTLKMDMFHTGKEDPHDDHKFVNERLLEVALLDAPVEGRDLITLEDCLEHYFNNRIEVKRHLENQRRNTLKSSEQRPYFEELSKVDKEPGTHIEVAEVPETPTAATPVAETPKTFGERLRPTMGRKRQDSIFSQRKVELVGVDPEALTKTDSNLSTQEPVARKLSTRTEVLMPAWQFFKLLPWYTDNMPTSDAQVAAHFAHQRPILGICLKRYSYTNDGQARKREDYVDIPLEIAVPNFVGGEDIESGGREGEQVGGNFQLLLQSVVCHRGMSVHSGHYVSLCRRKRSPTESRRGSAESEEPDEDPWVRFDDLARERITDIDIHQALKTESPYLLFYQVQPIGSDDDSTDGHQLPSYTEATSRSQSDATPLEKPHIHEPSSSEAALTQVMSDPLPPPTRASTDATDWEPSATERSSFDATSTLDVQQRGRIGAPNTTAAVDKEGRRKSLALDNASVSGSTSASAAGSIVTDPASNSVPSTPGEEKANVGFLGVANRLNLTGPASRRGSNKSAATTETKKSARSRPTSSEGRNRLSLNIAKLTQRMSKGASSTALPAGDEGGPVIKASEAVARELEGQKSVVDGSAHAALVGEKGADVTERTRMPASQPPVVGGVEGKGVGAGTLSKKERKRLKGQTHPHGHGGKEGEERECVVM